MKFPDLPDWSFDVDEVSAGVYKAVGVDRYGRRVEAVGVDPDELLERCKRDAADIIASVSKASDS